VGCVTAAYCYRTRAVLLSPRSAFLCGSKSPCENASFGGCEEALYYIAREFRHAALIRSETILQKERTARLSPLLQDVERNYAEPITLTEPACLAKMSVPQFVRLLESGGNELC
jgi:hypothetical protein